MLLFKRMPLYKNYKYGKSNISCNKRENCLQAKVSKLGVLKCISTLRTVYQVLNAMLNYCDFPDLKQIAVKTLRIR